MSAHLCINNIKGVILLAIKQIAFYPNPNFVSHKKKPELVANYRGELVTGD